MKLRNSVRKVNGSGTHREFTALQSFDRVRPHLHSAGVTRIAEITWLDRVGIPVYNAIVPRSNDVISVYNGKGTTRGEARTSAVMEAIERFSAGLPKRPAAITSYEELVKSGRAVLNPHEINIPLTRHYRSDAPLSWVEAFDLLNEETVLVPHDCAVYSLSSHEPRHYEVSTTNGLASGNSLEEAICHALTELIERDSMSNAELVSNRLCQILEKGLFIEPQPEELTLPLRHMHPHMLLDTLPLKAQRLVEMFRDAGLTIRIVHITSELGIPSFLAVVAEELGANTSKGHGGFGTHPDAEVAVIRAITECAQSRVVDIQAMREDIRLPQEQVGKYQKHVQRSSTLDKGAWAWDPRHHLVSFSQVPSYLSGDVMDDVRLMLDRLREVGVPRVLVVDLSPPGIPVKVVRVIVPQLESWAVDHSRIGLRGLRAWKLALGRLRGGEGRADARQEATV